MRFLLLANVSAFSLLVPLVTASDSGNESCFFFFFFFFFYRRSAFFPFRALKQFSSSCSANFVCGFHSFSRCDWFAPSSHDFAENK